MQSVVDGLAQSAGWPRVTGLNTPQCVVAVLKEREGERASSSLVDTPRCLFTRLQLPIEYSWGLELKTQTFKLGEGEVIG